MSWCIGRISAGNSENHTVADRRWLLVLYGLGKPKPTTVRGASPYKTPHRKRKLIRKGTVDLLLSFLSPPTWKLNS